MKKGIINIVLFACVILLLYVCYTAIREGMPTK